MNSIDFKINKNKYLIVNGIDFSKSIIVKPIIDGEDVISRNFEENALMILSEWKRCGEESGDYLLFTSLIGIADDGGWELCPIHHGDGCIFMRIPYNGEVIHYKFDKKLMKNAIKKLEAEVSLILSKEPDFHLEPVNVVFPE